MNGKRILVVDDEPHITRVTKLCLERAGFEVEVAPDGLEALELLKWRPFHAVVTDIMMPRMAGRELCERIRERMPDLSIPLFVVTSSSEDEHREWARELDHTWFLEKPLSPRQLVREVCQALGVEPESEAVE